MPADFVESTLLRIRLAKGGPGDSRGGPSEQLGAWQRRWSEGRNVPLGAYWKCQIAKELAARMGSASAAEIGREAVKWQLKLDINDRPRRAGGPDAGQPFTADTYAGLLNLSAKNAPTEEYLEACATCVLQAVDTIIAPHRKPEAKLHDILMKFNGTSREALEAALGTLKYPPTAGRWDHIESAVHGDTPNSPARGLKSENFEADFERLCTGLRTLRSAQVSGPRYSGKHAMLRKVVERYKKKGFETADGSTIKLCVLSLHEFSPIEAISRIADFYRKALAVDPSGDSVPELLAEISHLSRRLPAMFVIAGLDAVDENEVIRALNQDLPGQMVSRILAGHPQTRLLVSTSTPKDASRPGPAAAFGGHMLSFDLIVVPADPRVAAINYEYRALRQTAWALADRKPELDTDRLPLALGDLWVEDDELRRRALPQSTLSGLSDFVVGSLLEPREVCCLGLVAMTHDGLLKRTIRDIVNALADAFPDDERWRFDPVAILESLPDEIVRKPSSGGRSSSSCFQIERALRDSLLEHWKRSASLQFRASCWGLARAAASEARRLRVRSGLDVSAGRDVQVLVFLLAAIDGTSATEGGKEVSEQTVLPPLRERDAKMPSDSEILRFARINLFERDLALSARNGVHLLDDARLRLAAVRPFIDSAAPWLAATEDDPTRWTAQDCPPWSAFDVNTKLRLLEFACAAASRLNLRRLISHLVRIAESAAPIPKMSEQQRAILTRIQIYEIDLGLLLGRDPAVPVTAASFIAGEVVPGLLQLGKKIKTLLDGLPAGTTALRIARGKLRTRLAELLHLRGRRVEAYRMFVRARLEAGEDPDGIIGNQIVSGRSQRMLTRLLVDVARADLFRTGNAAPIAYDDQLKLPMLRRLGPRPSPLIRAERVIVESVRSLSSGSPNDWLGAKIDQSRLDAVELRYARALTGLAQARLLVRSPGVSRDIVLELLSVEGRTLTDAAAFAMATGGMAQGDERRGYVEELRRIARFLRIDAIESFDRDWRFAVSVSAALCERAGEVLGTLMGLLTAPDAIGTRYDIFAQYLGVWLSVVRSRQTVTGTYAEADSNVDAQLRAAGKKLENVLKDMVRSDYYLYKDEASLLITALLNARARVAITVPPEILAPQTI